MLRLREWILAFVNAYREEANRLTEEERKFFGDYVKEQVLDRSCQIEALQFRNPYRLILVFLFDETLKDCMIATHNANWSDLSAVETMLRYKYSKLELTMGSIVRTLASFRKTSMDKADYGIDFSRNICYMAFSHEVRIEALRMPWALEHNSSPQAIAKTIFHINCCQAWDE